MVSVAKAVGRTLLRRLIGLLVVTIVLGGQGAQAIPQTPIDDATAAGTGSSSCGALDQRHALWSAILRRYVHDGQVDYAGLRRHGTRPLSRYLRSLASVCSASHATWSRAERLAFWINAYNAYTVRLILDHYPLSSIRNIGVLPGAAFRLKFIPMRPLTDETLSLNDIEHDIVRKDFREPRVHFALVCASKSCPMLRSEAYRASDLEAQLDDQARRFLRDPTKNRFDAETRTLQLSAIFSWYREDFEREGRTLADFVAPYADAPVAAAVRDPQLRVQFLEYDWSLNGR